MGCFLDDVFHIPGRQGEGVGSRLRCRVGLDESSHALCQVMLADFPNMRLLPAVSLPEVAKRYHLVVDVVELPVKAIAPLDAVVRVDDLDPASVFMDHIRDVIEQSHVHAWERGARGCC